MAKKQSRPREKKRVVPDDLQELANVMNHFGKRYGELAQMMRDNKVEEIHVSNWKTLRTSLTYITAATAAAFAAYEDHLLSSGVFQSDEEE